MSSRILMFGSRSYAESSVIFDRVEALVPQDVLLIVGGAPGADSFAENAARRLGVQVAVLPALWDAHGKSAGHRRNAFMVGLLRPETLDRAEGFLRDPRAPSPGSLGSIRLLKQAKVRTLIFDEEANSCPEVLANA